MQTQQESKNTHSNMDSLAALLASFRLMQAAKPLSRSQSELAMAAVFDASKVVGGNLPQPVYKQGDPRVRASSLPVGIPSYTLATPSTLPANPVHAKPLVRPGLTPPHPVSPQLDRPPIKICLYKTEMCRGWEATGRCRYGSKCQFAHGPQELQPVQRHPKYKTEICRIFAQTGLCRYGKRCRFIHPETSTDLNLLPHSPLQTDQHTLYQTPSIAQQSCSQQCCSAIACPAIPDNLGYASPQAAAQYSGLHPATYQDHFLRPVPVNSQPACFGTPPYTNPYSSSAAPITTDTTHFQTSPYTASYSSPAVPMTSDAPHLESTPYASADSSSSGSVPDGHSHTLLTPLRGPGQVPAINSGLLGSGHMYSVCEPHGFMLGGTAHGGLLETSPKGVLEFAAMHSCGYSSGLSHALAGMSKPFGSSLYDPFTTYA